MSDEMQDILKNIETWILKATEEERDAFWDGLHLIHIMSLIKIKDGIVQ